MGYARAYDLSFVSKKHSKSGTSEIVISVPNHHISSFNNMLARIIPLYEKKARQYVGKHDTFLNNGRIGYRGCCRIEDTAKDRHIVLELQASLTHQQALTLNLILNPLNVELFDSSLQKREQYLELWTSCEDSLHGYAVYGTIFPLFGSWLIERAKDRRSGTNLAAEIVAHRIAHDVSEVMEESWRSLTKSRFKKYAQCSCELMHNGRFSLNCFGNACDLSIYPDQTFESGENEGQVEFSSHNVDNAVQQLTLIAGLARLVEHAKKEVAPSSYE